jgi:hypothetical protein
MALTSGWRVPVQRGAVGSDSSCRRPLWPRRGRQRRRVVVEVTGRSNGGLRLSEQWRGRGDAAWQAAGPALACRASEPAGQARPEERELGGGAGRGRAVA